MALEDILKPKPKEEVIAALKGESLDNELIEIIEENDDAYYFAMGFLFYDDTAVKKRIRQLNGLCHIIRKMKG